MSSTKAQLKLKQIFREKCRFNVHVLSPAVKAPDKMLRKL